MWNSNNNQNNNKNQFMIKHWFNNIHFDGSEQTDSVALLSYCLCNAFFYPFHCFLHLHAPH